MQNHVVFMHEEASDGNVKLFVSKLFIEFVTQAIEVHKYRHKKTFTDIYILTNHKMFVETKNMILRRSQHRFNPAATFTGYKGDTCLVIVDIFPRSKNGIITKLSYAGRSYKKWL